MSIRNEIGKQNNRKLLTAVNIEIQLGARNKQVWK